MLTSDDLIKRLNLEKHCEGGYFYQTFRSATRVNTVDGSERRAITSIYYLLTRESHLSVFAKNTHDLILYHHLGDPLKIIFLDEDGHSEKMLGPDLIAGQQLQIACPAHVCKAYDLMDGEYALIGEAVAPGFEYADMEMPSRKALEKAYPHSIEQIKKYALD